ncbi:MAG: hypothetical protein JKY61_00065 [Planctomycetes bacterium]|nr:hypothetical protein [Planctomycetota bacterium]
MDDIGRYVEGGTIWTGIPNESLATAKFRRCPIAEINEGVTHHLMHVYRLLSIDGVLLGDVVSKPTTALLDGLAAITQEVAAVQSERARARKADADVKAKLAAQSGRR